METPSEPYKDSAAATSSNAPDLQQKIEQLAKEKGISLDQARSDILRSSAATGTHPAQDKPVDSLAEEERELE